MFGVAPPQTLYHTRAAPSSAGVLSSAAGPSSPAKQHRSSSYSPSSPQGSPRNANQSAYTRNKVKKKGTRPGTADSAEPLMNDLGEDGQHKFGFSEVYEHYRHSLNSLNDIIDRVCAVIFAFFLLPLLFHSAGSSLISRLLISRTTRPLWNVSTI